DTAPRDLLSCTPLSHWLMGNSWRCMCPIGPYIYLFEEGEASRMYEMEIQLWVNDELRQHAHTKDMITKAEQALTLASEGIDLEAGDVVLTGTPGGVAIQAPSKTVQNLARLFLSEEKLGKLLVKKQLKKGRFLKEGDVIQASLKSADGKIHVGEQRSLIVKK
ncbi:MAG: fumarylacetoacetate hydrolase family protein, partial [Bacteroidota bacterium]